MATIHTITLPNGTSYDIEDSYARSAIANLNSFSIQIVTSLPTDDIDTHTIYMILHSGVVGRSYVGSAVVGAGQENNVYDEYIYINNEWELIGTTAINLNEYAKKEDIPTIVQSDWDENDDTDPTYIKNRTHYKISNGYVFPVDLTDLYNSLSEDELTFYIDDKEVTYSYSTDDIVSYDIQKYNEYFPTNEITTDLNVYSSATLTIDGTDYELTSFYEDGSLIYYDSTYTVFVQYEYNMSSESTHLVLTIGSNSTDAISSMILYLPIRAETFEYIKLDNHYLDGILIKPGFGDHSEVLNYSKDDAKMAYGEYSHVEGHGETNAIRVSLTGNANVKTYSYTLYNSNSASEMPYIYGQPVFIYSSYEYTPCAIILSYDSTESTVTLDRTLDSDSSISNKTYYLGAAGMFADELAHAEGSSTRACGKASHSEGFGSTIIGSSLNNVGAHAEGYGTTVNATEHGEGNHAEGYYTTASGSYGAHVEGDHTTVSGGHGAHAEGYYTTASGQQSHVEGYYTTAQRRSQHVFGEFNVLDTTNSHDYDKGSYVEIVGNGTSNSSRSNARTLDWSGNEVLAGKLTVGTGPTNNMDVATKQYVDSATPSASSSAPSADGASAAVGTSTAYARADHVHPKITQAISISNNVITLTGSDGTSSSVTLPVYSGGVTGVTGATGGTS